MNAATPTSGQDTDSKRAIGRAARGSALNLIGAAAATLSTLGLTVLVTRQVSPPEAGVFFSTTSVFVIAVACGQLGTDTGLVYFISRARRSRQSRAMAGYFRAALGPVMLVAGVTAVVTLLLSGQIAGIINPDQKHLASGALIALGLLVPFAALENVALAAARGLGTMRPYTVLEQLARPLLQLVLAGCLLALGTPVNLAWSWSLPYLLVGVVALVWWRHLSRPALADASPPVSGKEPPSAPAGEFWRFVAPRSFASIAQVAMQRFDIVLVAAIAGASAAAVYTAATRFIVVGQLARNAVSLAVQPHFAASGASKDYAGTKTLLHVSTGWLMGVTWPFFITVLLVGEPLLKVFGNGYVAGLQSLTVLCVAMLLTTLCGDVDILLIMSGRTLQSMANMVVSLAAQIGLDLLLIPSHGILGAAIGWGVAIVLKNVMALVQVAVLFHVSPANKEALIVALASVGCVGLPLFLVRVTNPSVTNLLVALVISALLFGATMWKLRSALHLDLLLPRRMLPNS